MDSRDYGKILDAMPETGVYVIREEDHELLYFNHRMRQALPEIRLGMPCDGMWNEPCSCCPLLSMEDRRESVCVGRIGCFGGMVTLTASRILWEDSVPAFVLTVTPHADSGSPPNRQLPDQKSSGEEIRFRAVEDQVHIISSLSRLFFSTYYMNLEQDTFRTVTQLRRVGDVLGDEVCCTAALQIYANHFIHPDDRAEYLRVMSIPNLRENLRWWRPSVAVEYRKLAEEPDAGPNSWSWVRATVILARTDEDDMPKTAMYVAQEIVEAGWTG